jgi:peptide/nickel transport system substrate-binding protein
MSIAALAAVALGVTACSGAGTTTSEPTATDGAAASAEIDKDAVIEAGISYSLSGGIDPMITTGAVTVAANWHVFEGLTELDPATREVYAALGAELPTKVDDTHYEVDLREGAVFHDGNPVTVDDVVFSFQRVLDPASKSLYASFIGFIDTVTAVDEDTVSIALKYPFSLVPERLAVVKVVEKSLIETSYDAFNALPVGTGPYKMTRAVPDDAIEYDRFDEYNGPRPALAAGMVWNLLSDSAARVTAISSGTVGAIEDVPYIDVPTLEGTVDVESVQSFGTLFMMFNTDKAPFDDVRVRQALFYALDTKKMVDNGLLGNGEVATSFLPKTHPNYNEASTTYAYDPAKAKKMLADAGVSNLSITLLTTDTGWVSDIAPLIKEDLDAIGVSTTLDIGQSGGQYTKVDAGELEVMVAPGDPSVFGNDPDLLMRWWYGDNVWSQSRYRWADDPKFAKLQNLLDGAARATGDDQQELWNEAFDLISDEVPLYPLLHRQLPTAWDSTTLVVYTPLRVPARPCLHVGVATSPPGAPPTPPGGAPAPPHLDRTRHDPPLPPRRSPPMSAVLRLTGRRLVQLPVMILGITLLVFVVMSFSKVDPAIQALGEGASLDAREDYREQHGLNDPLFVRYLAFLAGLLRFDLGTYSARQTPVSTAVSEALPVTLQLTFLGLAIAVVFSLLLGLAAALYRDGWPDKVVRVLSVAALATPSFWLAVLLIQSVTLALGLLPAAGPLPDPLQDPVGYLQRMALPAIALAVPVIGSLTRVVRTAVVEELGKDYVRTAIGAGLPRVVVVGRNVLRNALITPITVLGLRVGYLIGGAVVIEIIFALPGMGTLILNGVTNNEPNLVQGVTLTVALAFVIVNIVVDLLYVLVNPRIRTV